MGAKKVVLVDTDILIKVFATSCVQCFAGFRAISMKAAALMKKYIPVKQLLTPDGLIAATALHHQMELYTDNKDDFRFVEGLKFYSYSFW